MLFVHSLSSPEIICLRCMSKDHPSPWTRIRANSILLSNKRTPLQDIASLHGVCRQTLSIWLTNWNINGIFGLIDKEGRGRRAILSANQEEEVLKIIATSPRSLKQALEEINSRLGIKLSKSTLKRLCKKKNLAGNELENH